ncbi:MAG TPA: FtsQ-type POTRA domain-containing protein [Acidimicrobiales bacterium]|jgi:cell division protein FtsQ|nr:FtsQ-type POTRA domain-containing protein [Acidimicrobiales bacterium]HJM32882.1 FtsQ-type POTRA domain-containing protein [Acidimicrobiales bacterium]
MSGDDDAPTRSVLRRLWWLWVPVGILLLGVLGYASTRSTLLDVDRIEVEGAGIRVTERTVREVAAIEVGQALLDLDLDAINGRLTALPWVAEATVRRKWSGTVYLRILERTAVVVAVDPVGAQVLLDAVGAVLETVDPASASDPDLPHIRVDGFGPPGSRVSGVGPLLRAAEAVPPDLGAWIVALVPTGDGIRAELVGGAVAEFGISDDYREQVRALATVLTKVVLTCLREVDVSIPANPVVRRGAC